MVHRNYLRTLTLTAVLVAATALAQTPYDEGQKALREQNWVVAADYFKRAAKEDKETADASMYWRAHALYKAGRRKEAERQITPLVTPKVERVRQQRDRDQVDDKTDQKLLVARCHPTITSQNLLRPAP